MRPTLFLDRDGIINEIVMRGHIVGSPRTIGEFKLRQDFLDIVPALKAFDGYIFIVSNQPDIERGLMSNQTLAEMDHEILKYFQPTEIKYCTCSDGDHCRCKKPKPGMILELISKYELDKNECSIIGDSYKDIDAGFNAGIKTIFLKTDYNQHTLSRLPDIEIFSLKEFFLSKI